MKHKYFLFLLVCLFLSAGVWSQGPAETQEAALTFNFCPDETNIGNTNVCGPYGDGIGNSFWNWELTDPLDPLYCRNWYARTTPTGFLTAMGSPFVNATSGKMKIIADNQDYTKAKGWELLQRKFGCLSLTANPYFVLYNKYTGMIRVYVYLTNSAANYQQLLMTIKSVYNTRPAVLSGAHDILLATDKYLSNQAGNSDDDVLVSLNESVGSNNWAVGEFYTMLDHNIAASVYNNASLEITVYGVITSTLNAKIKGTSVTAGTLKDAVFRTSSATAGGSTFNFTAQGERITKLSKSIDDFIKGINTNAKKVSDKLLTNNDPLLKGIGSAADFIEKNTRDKADFEKIFSSVSGFLGIAGKTLSFAGSIIGFIKGSSGTPAAAPSYTNYNLELDGTISSNVVVNKFVVKIPATSPPGNNSNNATYYNCPMGILNLRTTPRLDTLRYNRRALLPNYMDDGIAPTTVQYCAYRLKEDVQVVVNSGAGLQVTSIEGALVARMEKLPNSPGTGPVSFDPFEPYPVRAFGRNRIYTYFNHMRADIEASRLEVTHYDADDGGYHIIQTPFYKLECLRSASINVAVPLMKTYLRIRATLKRSDGLGEPVFFVKDYQVENVGGQLTDIPADITYNVAALPPYANYTIPPNVNAYGPLGGPVIPDPADIIYPDGLTPGNVVLNAPTELKYNHSITTSNIYYTTVTCPTPTVVFRAGGSITLKPNFQATAGSVFLATTDFGNVTPICSPAPDILQYVFGGSCYNGTVIAQKAAANIAEETPVQQEETVYPNPASGILYIKIKPGEKPGMIRAIDVTGKSYMLKITRQGGDLLELNVSGLPNGLYTIQTLSQGAFRVHKVEIYR